MSARAASAAFDEGEAIFAFENFKPRFGSFALRGVDSMTAMFFWVGAKLGVANPLVLLRFAANNREITLVHPPGLEQFAKP